MANAKATDTMLSPQMQMRLVDNGDGTFSYAVAGSITSTSGGNLPIVGSTVTAPAATSISTGGTSQSLFAAASTRVGVVVFNPDANNSLWVAPNNVAASANAAGNIEVRPGASINITGPMAATAIAIVGAVTGQLITAWGEV